MDIWYRLFFFVFAKANSFLLAISLFLLGFVCNKQKYEMITIKQLIEDILTKILEIENVITVHFEKKHHFLK